MRVGPAERLPTGGSYFGMVVEEGDLVALAAALGWAATTVLARYISRAIPAIWYNALRIAIASVAIYLLMAVVLYFRPKGLFPARG